MSECTKCGCKENIRFDIHLKPYCPDCFPHHTNYLLDYHQIINGKVVSKPPFNSDNRDKAMEVLYLYLDKSLKDNKLPFIRFSAIYDKATGSTKDWLALARTVEYIVVCKKKKLHPTLNEIMWHFKDAQNYYFVFNRRGKQQLEDLIKVQQEQKTTKIQVDYTNKRTNQLEL